MKVNWVIVAIISISLGSMVIGYIILSNYLAQGTTIAAFDKDVSESLSAYLGLTIEDYGITGNRVWAKGTVYYHGQQGYQVSGASIVNDYKRRVQIC